MAAKRRGSKLGFEAFQHPHFAYWCKPLGIDPQRYNRSHQESPLRYRADIDGLRALSVIVVVFYHAGVPLVGGGYVGVDVFFVISGFLITSLILQE